MPLTSLDSIAKLTGRYPQLASAPLPDVDEAFAAGREFRAAGGDMPVTESFVLYSEGFLRDAFQMGYSTVVAPKLQSGVDFPDTFAHDRYVARHAEGLNAYDPESFITGAELARGKTYRDKRNFTSEAQYTAYVSGSAPVDSLPVDAPR